MTQETKFPLYLMKIEDKQKFMPIREAGVNYDNGYVSVEIVGLVLEADFSVRKITREEENQIGEIADRYSESK